MNFRDIPVRRCRSCGFYLFRQASRSNAFQRLLPARLRRLNATAGRAGEYQRQLRGRTLVGRPWSGLELPGRWMRIRLFDQKLRDRLRMRVKGIDLSRYGSTFAREKLGLDVHHGLLENANLPEGSFDAVGCFEVIEHVLRPVEFVRQLTRMIRPGGWLIIRTDNFDSWVCRSLGPQFPKWIPHEHVSHYHGRNVAGMHRTSRRA